MNSMRNNYLLVDFFAVYASKRFFVSSLCSSSSDPNKSISSSAPAAGLGSAGFFNQNKIQVKSSDTYKQWKKKDLILQGRKFSFFFLSMYTYI